MQECPYKVQERAYRGKKERMGEAKRKAVNGITEADVWCRGYMCGGGRYWYMMRMGIRYPRYMMSAVRSIFSNSFLIVLAFFPF